MYVYSITNDAGVATHQEVGILTNMLIRVIDCCTICSTFAKKRSIPFL